MTTFKKFLITGICIILLSGVSIFIAVRYATLPEIIYKDECEPCKMDVEIIKQQTTEIKGNLCLVSIGVYKDELGNYRDTTHNEKMIVNCEEYFKNKRIIEL